MKNLLISRSEAALLLGVSIKQMVRVEKSRKIRPIKLVKTKNGSVYYNRHIIEEIIQEGDPDYSSS